jgi:hypothetical protein
MRRELKDNAEKSSSEIAGLRLLLRARVFRSIPHATRLGAISLGLCCCDVDQRMFQEHPILSGGCRGRCCTRDSRATGTVSLD